MRGPATGWLGGYLAHDPLPEPSPHAETWGRMVQIVAVIVFVMVGMAEAVPAVLRGLTWASAGFVVAHLRGN